MKPIIIAFTILLMPFSFQQVLAKDVGKPKSSFDFNKHGAYLIGGGAALIGATAVLVAIFYNPKKKAAETLTTPEATPERPSAPASLISPEQAMQKTRILERTPREPRSEKEQKLDREAAELVLRKAAQKAKDTYKPVLEDGSFFTAYAKLNQNRIPIQTSHAGIVPLGALCLTDQQLVRGRGRQAGTEMNIDTGAAGQFAITETPIPAQTVVTKKQIQNAVLNHFARRGNTLTAPEIENILNNCKTKDKRSPAQKVEELDMLKHFAKDRSMGKLNSEGITLTPLMYPRAPTGDYRMNLDGLDDTEDQQATLLRGQNAIYRNMASYKEKQDQNKDGDSCDSVEDEDDDD